MIHFFSFITQKHLGLADALMGSGNGLAVIHYLLCHAKSSTFITICWTSYICRASINIDHGPNHFCQSIADSMMFHIPFWHFSDPLLATGQERVIFTVLVSKPPQTKHLQAIHETMTIAQASHANHMLEFSFGIYVTPILNMK